MQKPPELPITGRFGGIFFKKSAVKLQQISDIRPTLGFTEFDFIENYRASFATSEFGYVTVKYPNKRRKNKTKNKAATSLAKITYHTPPCDH